MAGLLLADFGKAYGECIVNLPTKVMAAVNAAILADPEEVNDIFDDIASDDADELAADKAAKIARYDWSDLVTFPGGDV